MLKAHRIGGTAAEVRYYAALGRDAHEYYSESVRPGVWLGEGAMRLGLWRDVEEDVFADLLRGKSPDGKNVWVAPPKNSKKKRRCRVDLTFQVPKSVSIALSQASPDMREEIIQRCEKALKETLRAFTEFCAVTRQKRLSARRCRACWCNLSARHGSPVGRQSSRSASSLALRATNYGDS